LKFFEKRFAFLPQSFFEAFGAIAIAARPRFGAVFVPAIFSTVRIRDAQEFKKLFPVRPFFLQRCVAETRFHPVRDAILADARLLQVINIFVARDGTVAKRAVGDGLPEGVFFSRFDCGFDEVTHTQIIKLKFAARARRGVRIDQTRLTCDWLFLGAGKITRRKKTFAWIEMADETKRGAS